MNYILPQNHKQSFSSTVPVEAPKLKLIGWNLIFVIFSKVHENKFKNYIFEKVKV